MSNGKQQFHWFTSSVFNWCAHDDLGECIAKQKQVDRQTVKGQTSKRVAVPFKVYKVPVPNDYANPYEIDEYRPRVSGTKFIAACSGK